MGKYLDLIKTNTAPSSGGNPAGPYSSASMEAGDVLHEDSSLPSGSSQVSFDPAASTTETTLTTKAPQPGPADMKRGAATTETTKVLVLEMPLTKFEVEGCPLEIEVPGLTETLWFVPGQDHVHVLVARGIRRGRIWTADELRAVSACPQADRDELLTMSQVKARFDGVIVEVREEP